MESRRVANKMIDLFSNGQIWTAQWTGTIPIFVIQSNPFAIVNSILFSQALLDCKELYDVRMPDNPHNPYDMQMSFEDILR